MTPASTLSPRAARPVTGPVTGPATGRLPDFAGMLGPQTGKARASRQPGRFRRLLAWLLLPLPAGHTATDVATRLEIMTRGGFPG